MKSQSAFAASEAVANIRASPVISIGLALIALTVGFLAAALPTSETGAIARDWSSQIAAGSAVLVITAEQGGVDAAVCDGVNAIAGVVGAGGVFYRAPVALAQAVGRPMDMLVVSPGFPAASWASYTTSSAGSVIIPEELARDLGLSAGVELVYRELQAGLSDEWSVSLIDVVPPGRNRVNGVNDAAVFVSAEEGQLQSCYVSADPDSLDVVRAALLGTFGAGYVVGDFLESTDTVRTPSEQMTSRIGYWVSIAMGGLLAIIHLVVWFMRRADFALYRAMRMSNSNIRIMLATEIGVIAALPLAFGALVGFMTQSDAPILALTAGMFSYSAVTAMSLLTPVLGSLLLLRQPTIEAIKGA